MILSIYTSRILLKTLGIEDYGLYNIVGGVVAMFLSLKNIFAASVQRFINYEKGNGNTTRVNEIFNTSVIIHIGIAAVFIIVVEIFGLWYINNKLVVSYDRIDTANFVFHCSIIATAISIITIPYDAVIIANEKMNFYAKLSIIDACLRLLIVFLLPVFPFEFLCTYATLILIVSLFMRFLTVLYTKRFPECKYCKVWNKQTVKDLSAFAGWNLFGCMSSSILEEGANMILNLFGGLTANAARSVAYQIRNAIMSLSNNVFIASQPFIVQQAASVNINYFWNNIFTQSRAIFYVISLTALPIFIFSESILCIWLDDVPSNSIEFTRTILIYLVIMSFQKSLDLAFKAYNKLPLYQITDSVVTLLTLPLIYLTLRLSYPLYYTFILFSLVRIFDYIIILIIAHKKLNLSICNYLKNVIYPAAITLLIYILIAILCQNIPQTQNIFILFFYILIVVIVAAILLYLIVLTKYEKKLIINYIQKFSNKK